MKRLEVESGPVVGRLYIDSKNKKVDRIVFYVGDYRDRNFVELRTLGEVRGLGECMGKLGDKLGKLIDQNEIQEI